MILNQAKENRQKEMAIRVIARLGQIAAWAGIIFVAVSLLLTENYLYAILIAIMSLLLHLSSITHGASTIYIKWYSQIIEQEEAKYQRYGDGSRER